MIVIICVAAAVFVLFVVLAVFSACVIGAKADEAEEAATGSRDEAGIGGAP